MNVVTLFMLKTVQIFQKHKHFHIHVLKKYKKLIKFCTNFAAKFFCAENNYSLLYSFVFFLCLQREIWCKKKWIKSKTKYELNMISIKTMTMTMTTKTFLLQLKYKNKGIWILCFALQKWKDFPWVASNIRKTDKQSLHILIFLLLYTQSVSQSDIIWS